ncbi:MAG: hypothetical protein WAL47_09450 [Pyrinomonadaceae bacterium]
MKLQKIGSGILAVGFVFLVGVASSTVQGQDRWGRYDQTQRERDRQWEREQRRDQRRGNRNGRYGRNDDGYGNYGGSAQLRQTALNAGFNEGTKEGRKDRSRGERFDFTDEGAFRSATKDYSSRLGDRETYRRYFREAFENGYRDGYAGY